jgi:hypothetical protein
LNENLPLLKPNARDSFVDANNNSRVSDRYVEDGSFVKLKNIQYKMNILIPPNHTTTQPRLSKMQPIKQINSQIETYTSEFKENIRKRMLELGFEQDPRSNELMEYIYEYKKLEFGKEDITKRKRNKNVVPECNRCNALLMNNEQCTRRKKEESDFCGTHVKGTPNGVLKQHNQPQIHRVEVVAKEIHGIVYYIDDKNRIYNTEEIMAGKVNPAIVGYWNPDDLKIVYL